MDCLQVKYLGISIIGHDPYCGRFLQRIVMSTVIAKCLVILTDYNYMYFYFSCIEMKRRMVFDCSHRNLHAIMVLVASSMAHCFFCMVMDSGTHTLLLHFARTLHIFIYSYDKSYGHTIMYTCGKPRNL